MFIPKIVPTLPELKVVDPSCESVNIFPVVPILPASSSPTLNLVPGLLLPIPTLLELPSTNNA